MAQTSPAQRPAAPQPVRHAARPRFAPPLAGDTQSRASHQSQRAITAALVDLASSRYRAAGRFAYHFARCKLAMDPVFEQILARGLIPDGARVLDLGCGQGLLPTWLLAARDYPTHSWPIEWPTAPRLVSYLGVESMEKDVERARLALAAPTAAFEVAHADIRQTTFRAADVVVILDVLHYMSYDAQQSVLTRTRGAMSPAGALLLRVGDADGGLRFAMSKWVDQTTTLFRAHRLLHLTCRPLHEWRDLLGRIGFTTEVLPMSAGTPFANFLLVARPN